MLLTPEDLETIREAVEAISKGHATRWDIGTKVFIYKVGDNLIRIDIRK